MAEENRYKREVAVRCFSDEIADSVVIPKEDEEYAAQYVRIPSGALVNRVFFCGVLTEKEDVGTDSEFWKLTIADPKGSVKAFIGQYQEIALAAMADIEPPCYVSVVAKVKSNEHNEVVYFNLAPESINVIEESTYNHWADETESQTADRMAESNEAV
jgi:RPA family protein